MTSPRERLGARIRAERERLGWTQARLAEEATKASGGQVSIARSTLARQEAGEREPGILEAVYLAQALGVPLTALVAPDSTDLLTRASHLLDEYDEAEREIGLHAGRLELAQARRDALREQIVELDREASRQGTQFSPRTAVGSRVIKLLRSIG